MTVGPRRARRPDFSSVARLGGLVAIGKKLGLTLGEPLSCRRALTLRAVPIAAGIVGDAFVRAVLAALDVAAERRGAGSLLLGGIGERGRPQRGGARSGSRRVVYPPMTCASLRRSCSALIGL